MIKWLMYQFGRDSVKAGLWTVDWTMDWTMDWVAIHSMQSYAIQWKNPTPDHACISCLS